MLRSPCIVVTAVTALLVSVAQADEGHHHDDILDELTAERRIGIEAGDLWFAPAAVTVAAGETVRFVVTNTGALVHEFGIGTAAVHAEHREEMRATTEIDRSAPSDAGHHDMAHAAGGDSPPHHGRSRRVSIRPGETRELVWTFAEAADLEFACNMPGHYEAGMVGAIRFDD